MSPTKKRRQGKPTASSRKSQKERSLTFDDLVVEGAVPRVKVIIFPSRKKSTNKPTDRLVVELQCEV